MPQDPSAQLAEAERAELERVIEALAKWPRLSNLLRYMGDKLVSGSVSQLTEYNIATEVLGRSKTVFNAGEDAIARVETHRLRKRLATFYETEGKDHLIQVTLPAGSYVPVFVHKSEGRAVRLPSGPPDALESASGGEAYPPVRWGGRGWRYLVPGVCLAVAGLGSYLYLRAGGSSSALKQSTSETPAPVSAPLHTDAPVLPIRLLAGYDGPPRTDSAGRVWSPEQYFTGGGRWQRGPEFLARTSDPFIFEHSRTGDFSYDIPLRRGTYELHLYFSTPVRSDAGIFTFNVALNGQYVLDAFDINADALGENIADERVFRDVSPGNDGFVRIVFSGANAPPSLNAIEILPGIPHAQLPIRLITQRTPFTDRKGRFWLPDNYFMNGQLSGPAHPLMDSQDPDLFSGERFGHFTYAIPVDTRGIYTLVLHFAEFYFGTQAPGKGGAGSRVFKVMCNGQTLLDNFDIFKEAGSLHEVTRTFHHLRPTPQGKLNLTFEPISNNATISGIEVLDESR